jgi:predicted DNA binding CopG/RHH family protein
MKTSELKALASRNGLDPEQEGILYELESGIRDEAEHKLANTVEKRAQIAADHLREDPHYYSKLKGAGLMKARFYLRKHQNLVAVKKQVSKEGKTYQQTFYISPGEAVSHSSGIQDHEYGFAGRVAKAMGTKIPSKQLMTKKDMEVLKKKLDDGIAKGWKLGGGGDLKELGEFASSMKKSVFFIDSKAVLRKGKKMHVGKKKIDIVMKEFSKGTLKNSGGETVTDREQALAIAYAEAGLGMKKSGDDGMGLFQIFKPTLAKSKYLRRTGGPGHYKYIYKEGSGHGTGSGPESGEDKAKAEPEQGIKSSTPILPHDVTKLTHADTVTFINICKKLPLKKLRRNQELVEKQKEMAYKKKDDSVMARLDVMADIYTAAVDMKEFPGESTAKDHADSILESVKANAEAMAEYYKNKNKGKE